MKRYHLFTWWLHIEEAEDVRNTYVHSFETFEQAKAAMPHEQDYHAQIAVTQSDGSLRFIYEGKVEFATGQWATVWEKAEAQS